jgi:phage terminase small subunit
LAPSAPPAAGLIPPPTDAQLAFVLEYLRNGFNATRAYMSTHPNAGKGTANVEGSRILSNPSVRATIDDYLQPYQMSADEALARLAWDARADVRQLYDANGVLLPVHQWPDTIINSVRSIEEGPYGWKIRLNDSQAARRTILEVHGRLRNPNAGDALRDLAEILAEKWKG